MLSRMVANREECLLTLIPPDGAYSSVPGVPHHSSPSSPVRWDEPLFAGEGCFCPAKRLFTLHCINSHLVKVHPPTVAVSARGAETSEVPLEKSPFIQATSIFHVLITPDDALNLCFLFLFRIGADLHTLCCSVIRPLAHCDPFTSL